MSTEFLNPLGYLFLVCLVALAIIYILYRIFRSPFYFPYFKHSFDVSGKRKPDINSLIDDYLNETHFSEISNHFKKIQEWEKSCELKISKSLMKKYRSRQFKKCRDDAHAFIFYLTRQQTRYRQKNYVKRPYKVTQTVDQASRSYKELIERYEKLESTNHECSLRDYHSKEQRKLMTKELRKQIMVRDNYTCRKCGKYMPDEVGLQIDHIIPISKGGKTVPSNLQVLCSKCNGSKSNKI